MPSVINSELNTIVLTPLEVESVLKTVGKASGPNGLNNRILKELSSELSFPFCSLFNRSLEAGKEVRAVFCDISKAFDRMWHTGLLYKLKAAGVRGEVLEWFKGYLSDRKQRVLLPGAVSDWTSIKAGVPQGSILGPLLFLLYKPGRVAQSVSQGSWVRYPVWQHTFVSPSPFSRRAVVSYWRKYVHEVLVSRLGGLSLPRKSVVRLTRP